MVGPLSSEEIEDVVSSVRRLVSNEQNPRRVTRDLTTERLLLTPALRVVSELSPLSPLILDGPLPEPAVDAGSAPDPHPANEPAQPSAEAPMAELIEADWEDEIWAAPEVASLGEVALGAEEAEILLPPAEDAAPVAEAVEPAPDTIEDASVAGQDGLSEAWAQAETDWVEDEPVPFIPLRRRAEHLAARLAAGEVMDPDEAEEADETDEAAEADVQAAPAPDVAAELLDDDVLAADLDDDAPVARGIDDATEGGTQRMPTEILDADGTPLAVLDEAALQEIVRQMIREELQGSLGERITRNVRKLVRAEINRALVARDLD